MNEYQDLAPSLVRICGQCGVTFTKDNTGDLGHLQPMCNHCTKHPATYEKYKKLLEFVIYVADADVSLNNRFWRNTKGHSISKARELLKEIGEEV